MSEIKQQLLLGDFRWLETAVREGVEERELRRHDLEALTSRLHEAISNDLCELEKVLNVARFPDS